MWLEKLIGNGRLGGYSNMNLKKSCQATSLIIIRLLAIPKVA